MSNPETIRVMCPNLVCRKILAVPTAARGKTVRCRGCGTNIRIPAELASSAPKPTAPGVPGGAAAPAAAKPATAPTAATASKPAA
jgi:hypothetical protein